MALSNRARRRLEVSMAHRADAEEVADAIDAGGADGGSLKVELAAVTSGKGASLIGLEDVPDNYDATDVEAAFAETSNNLWAMQQTINELNGSVVRDTGVIHRTISLTSSQLTDGFVMIDGVSGILYLDGFKILVYGGTALDGTFSKVTIQDTATTPVALVEIAKAAFAGNALVTDGSTGVTAKLAYVTGATPFKGLKIVVDGTVTAGSDLRISLWGRCLIEY